ncbi:MAG: GTP cyclohydrolase I FolE2 [Candidatus Sumerlaeia bacterium]|nr:GTP cyclohydrolase I FolE2 [Candidatus Sumerlaeia bacterium]
MIDIQSQRDTRRMAIDKVGVKNVRYPMRVKMRSGGEQHTVAQIHMSVNLPHHFRGTHMSRFLEVLNAHRAELDRESFFEILRSMRRRLHAERSHMEMRFPYFLVKEAPVSGACSLFDVEAIFIGEAACRRGEANGADDCDFEFTLGVRVAVKTLCPCSKEISARGAHNQRGFMTVFLRFDGSFWIEDLVDIVESCASAPIYPLLKRPDEKWVTERAYDNPKFVEDLVRDVALRLGAEPRIAAWTVESENFESIHNHSAYAFMEGRNG